MRQIPLALAAILIALLAGAAPSRAQQGSGWIDPPMRPAAPPPAAPAKPTLGEPEATANAAEQAPARRREADRPRLAERLTAAYLATVSAQSEAMLADSPRFYGERILFHGRGVSLSALIAEKRRFVRRWPERRYLPRGAMRSACDPEGETCLVRTAFDFTAESPARGARSQGLGELTLTIRFGDGRPRIVAESSRVLRYGRPVLGADADLGSGRGARG